MTSSPHGKFQIIDLARSFSILAVMAGHFHGFPPPAVPFRALWTRIQENNTYGVCVFFVISGFLITQLIDRRVGGLFNPSFKEFYVRRIARLFPLLAVVIFLGMIFTFVFPEHSMKYLFCFKTTGMRFDSLFWISISTFCYNWYQVFFFDNDPGIYWGVLWSLSVEEQFYLFYPPLLKKLRTERRFCFWMVGVIFLGLFWRLGVFLWGGPYGALSVKASFGAFDQIAFGCLLYWAFRDWGGTLERHRAASILLCLAGIGILIPTYLGTVDRGVDLIYGPFFIALGAFFFLLGGLHWPIWESKLLVPFSLPGQYSYGLYLLHMLVFYLFFPWLIHFNVFLAFGLFTLIATLIAGLSYHFFELPANLRIREFFRLKSAGKSPSQNPRRKAI
jgi:peptidoglycan/LPS O-acetylase OafA/YrhL